MTQSRFPWKPEFAIGIPTIDRQHRRIVELLSQVLHASDGQAAERFIEAMVDYARGHFRAEEALMERYAYPRLSEHRREHGEISARVEAIREALEDPEVKLGQVRKLLYEWLAGHILANDFDRDLGEHLRHSHFEVDRAGLTDTTID